MFKKIPVSPISYWVGNSVFEMFDEQQVCDVAEVQEGLKTGDNERFIRNWYEVDYYKTSMKSGENAKWIYHSKGGDYRKWYGNQ